MPRPLFLPPDPAALAPRIARRNARRARRLLTRLLREPAARGPADRRALRALERLLRAGRGPRRRALLLDPPFRAWLTGAEEAMALAAPPSSPVRLLELAAGGAHLAAIAPRGRLDARSFARARQLGRILLAQRLRELPARIVLHLSAGEARGPLRLHAPEEPELGLSAGEILLSGLSGEILLRLPGRGAAARVSAGGIRFEPPARVEALPVPRVGCSRIPAGRRIRSDRRGLRSATHAPAGVARLGRGLDLLALAWPEGHRTVLAETHRVVPLSERGTVSFSLPSRPGVSYINLRGKSVVDLADDLLHESAHHRLHALEEVEPLLRPGGDPFLHSPWRRGRRPLRGILHAAYTFAWRAALLSRIARLPGRLPRAWLRAEVERERRALATTLRDLRLAAARELLTPAGRRLVAALSARLRRLER